MRRAIGAGAPMLSLRENLKFSADAMRSHTLRASLTILGLTMGVATLITVMTLIQGANLYVEQKIANLGTNVFQIGRLPFAVADFKVYMKALKNKRIELDDMRAVADGCLDCAEVGATVARQVRLRAGNQELTDVQLIGQTASMAGIDTREIQQGRRFTPAEDQRGARVCLIGSRIAEELFAGLDPIGRTVRAGSAEFQVIGTFEAIGSILGQDQDSFVIVPMGVFQRMYGTRRSVTLEIKAAADDLVFERALDQARLAMRARRHIGPGEEEDFFIATASTYISLWDSISQAFFAVFVLVSSISGIVGGIVIMNVMLVSVTERTKEIGIRRAAGATRQDILGQFLTESVVHCLIGGVLGITIGFAAALALDQFTAFPARVRPEVAVLGVVVSSAIGLFFGIYPARRAAGLDPVVALRSE